MSPLPFRPTAQTSCRVAPFMLAVKMTRFPWASMPATESTSYSPAVMARSTPVFRVTQYTWFQPLFSLVSTNPLPSGWKCRSSVTST